MCVFFIYILIFLNSVKFLIVISRELWFSGISEPFLNIKKSSKNQNYC